MQKTSPSKPLKISASRLASHDKCSWIYFCTYVLKLRSPSNAGSARGDVAHRVFECLLKEKRRSLVSKILKKGTITASKLVTRFVSRQLKVHGLTEFDKKKEHNFNLTDEMIVTGLSLDFYCQGWNLEQAELEFNYKGQGYELLGFIDKSATKPNQFLINDYKSSQEKMTKKEEDYNIQSLIYSLWSYRERGIIPFVRFIFLRFKDNPYIEKHYTPEQLEGFEDYLVYITQYLSDFNFEKATAGMAADKGFPEDKSFSGRTMCGRSKSPTDTKKDGGLMYACYYKWPFDYYEVYSKDNDILYTSKEKPVLKEGERMVEKKYLGCPAFNKLNYVGYGKKS